MPAKRHFDYDLLRDLIVQHPDTPRHQLAVKLTADNREKAARRILQENPGMDPAMARQMALRDPSLVVNARAVISAIYNYKDQWQAEGARLPKMEKIRYDDLIPWKIHPDHWMDRKIVSLRVISRMRRGLPVPADERKRAESFERRLRDGLEVVDVNSEGKPYVRPAEPSELDGNGQLIEIIARSPGKKADPLDEALRELRGVLEDVSPEDLRKFLMSAERLRRTS